MCVRYFVALFPSEKVLSCCSVTTSDNLSSEKRDVKDISTTQKVDLGGAKALMLLSYVFSSFQVHSDENLQYFSKQNMSTIGFRGGLAFIYIYIYMYNIYIYVYIYIYTETIPKW